MGNEIKLSWFTRRRLYWVGVNEDILRRCPSEIPKYVGFGTTILVTAMLASVSGGYAVYAISGNAVFPFLFGPLWGFLIFNLDSVIITSMRKPEIPSKDETVLWEERDVNIERQTIRLKARRRDLQFKQFYLFFVRFIVAVVLGFIISLPLETLIFNKRIEKQWGENKEKENAVKFYESLSKIDMIRDKRQIVARSAAEEDSLLYQDPQLKLLTSNNKQLLQRISQYETSKIEEQRKYNSNLVRSVDSFGNVSYKPNERAREAYRKINFYNNQISGSQRLVQDNNSASATLIAKLAPESEKIKAKAEKEKRTLDSIAALENSRTIVNEAFLKDYDRPDLIEKLEILSSLRSKNSAVMLASVLITLLFIIVEVAPVSVKFLSQRGPYDEILELDEKERVENERYALHQKFAEIRNDVKVETAKAEQRTDTDIAIHKKAMEALAENRSEIISELIRKSTEEEVLKIKKTL